MHGRSGQHAPTPLVHQQAQCMPTETWQQRQTRHEAYTGMSVHGPRTAACPQPTFVSTQPSNTSLLMLGRQRRYYVTQHSRQLHAHAKLRSTICMLCLQQAAPTCNPTQAEPMRQQLFNQQLWILMGIIAAADASWLHYAGICLLDMQPCSV